MSLVGHIKRVRSIESRRLCSLRFIHKVTFYRNFDDLLDAVLDELALCCDELLTLLVGLVEEAGVNLCLLVLQGHVASEDVAVLQILRHVGGTRRGPLPNLKHNFN